MQNLRRAYENDDKLRQLFNFLASRERTHAITKVSTALQWVKPMKLSHDAGYRLVKRLFRELERNGFGKYIEGRHGHPSRFETSYNIKELAKGVVSPPPIPVIKTEIIPFVENTVKPAITQNEVNDRPMPAQNVPTPLKLVQTDVADVATKPLSLIERVHDYYEGIDKALNNGNWNAAELGLDALKDLLKSARTMLERHN